MLINKKLRQAGTLYYQWSVVKLCLTALVGIGVFINPNLLDFGIFQKIPQSAPLLAIIHYFTVTFITTVACYKALQMTGQNQNPLQPT